VGYGKLEMMAPLDTESIVNSCLQPSNGHSIL
jgi:hypothetical protein